MKEKIFEMEKELRSKDEKIKLMVNRMEILFKNYENFSISFQKLSPEVAKPHEKMNP